MERCLDTTDTPAHTPRLAPRLARPCRVGRDAGQGEVREDAWTFASGHSNSAPLGQAQRGRSASLQIPNVNPTPTPPQPHKNSNLTRTPIQTLTCPQPLATLFFPRKTDD